MRTGFVIAAAALLAVGCGGGGGGSGTNSGGSTNPVAGGADWLIPQAEVADGGPGRDGIPSVDNPIFLTGTAVYTQVEAANGLVIGYENESTYKAVTHTVLDWHEILNDGEGPEHLVVSYCPLTGSGLLWQSTPTSGDPTYGVSGLLYNSNLILYDRSTQSHWSQMREEAVEGQRIRELPVRRPVVETRLDTWLEMYPDTQTVSQNTGFGRNYGQYPYGDYKTSDSLLFLPREIDPRLHLKTRVLGVQVSANAAMAYPIDEFADGPDAEVFNHDLGGTPIVVAGNAEKNLAVAFERTLADGTVPDFTAAGPLPIVMTDDEGNLWNVFGEAVNGPRQGERLALPPRTHISYWFAWAAFNAGSDIFERP